MKRATAKAMKEFYEEMEVEDEMKSVRSGDVDMPEDIPLIEQDFTVEEDEEEYSEEEVAAFLENVNFEESNNNLSFDQMMPQKFEETGVKYQMKEKVVQPHFLIIRDLVKKTPSVCNYRDCSYDGSQAIGFKNWDATPEKKRRIALAALEAHVQRKHKFTDTDIIDESQIPKSWLSSTLT